MSGTNKVLMVVMFSILSVLILGGVTLASGYVGAINYGAEIESSLKASKDNSKNILTQYGKKVVEVAQVPDMYKNDLIELTKTAISGRYGKDGSKAMFQFIKEQNPTLDSSLYKEIQVVIVSGRNEFQNSQTRILDIRRSYEMNLNSFPRGFFLKIAGYPKVNLSDFDVISSSEVDKVFETKKDDSTIKLR